MKEGERKRQIYEIAMEESPDEDEQEPLGKKVVSTSAEQTPPTRNCDEKTQGSISSEEQTPNAHLEIGTCNWSPRQEEQHPWVLPLRGAEDADVDANTLKMEDFKHPNCNPPIIVGLAIDPLIEGLQ